MGTPPFLPILSFLEYAVDKLFVSHDFPKKIPFLFFIKKFFLTIAPLVRKPVLSMVL